MKVTPLIAIVIIFIACYLMYALGMYMQRKLAKKNPAHPGLKSQSWGDIVLAGLLVLCMLIGVTSVEVAPESMIGSFLITIFSTWYGWLAIPVALYLFGVVGALIKTLFQSIKREN